MDGWIGSLESAELHLPLLEVPEAPLAAPVTASLIGSGFTPPSRISEYNWTSILRSTFRPGRSLTGLYRINQSTSSDFTSFTSISL